MTFGWICLLALLYLVKTLVFWFVTPGNQIPQTKSSCARCLSLARVSALTLSEVRGKLAVKPRKIIDPEEAPPEQVSAGGRTVCNIFPETGLMLHIISENVKLL